MPGLRTPRLINFRTSMADPWMGPYQVLEVKGAAVRLKLPPELGKVSSWINPRRLKFFHPRDAPFALLCPD